MNRIEKAAILLIPVLLVSIIIFYNSTNNEVKRKDNQTQIEESRLKNESEFEKVTRENIAELETEILLEANVESEDIVEEGDEIFVHYRGWLAADGEKFDESFSRGDEGYKFTVGIGVIDGWSEGVVGMKIGEVRRLFIPSDLGYGEIGSGGVIPPNADLIFDVELIKFND